MLTRQLLAVYRARLAPRRAHRRAASIAGVARLGSEPALGDPIRCAAVVSVADDIDGAVLVASALSCACEALRIHRAPIDGCESGPIPSDVLFGDVMMTGALGFASRHSLALVDITARLIADGTTRKRRAEVAAWADALALTAGCERCLDASFVHAVTREALPTPVALDAQSQLLDDRPIWHLFHKLSLTPRTNGVYFMSDDGTSANRGFDY